MKKRMALLAIAVLLLLSACGNEAIEDFSYTNQRGETVTNDSLKGEPWLAAFVFTNCDTVCPPMTFNLASIQEKLIDEGIEDYRIVAFSVDPARDTPEKMQEYLANYSVADESKWNLLTGYTQPEIAEFAKDNFQAFVKDDPSSDQVVHGTTFYLMDSNGEIAETYDGYIDVPIEAIVDDLSSQLE